MAEGSHYTDEQRREAVAHYVVLGNWQAVSEATGIPHRTCTSWAHAPWFSTLYAEVRAEKGAELDGAFTRIIHKAADELLDRLEHGDAVLIEGEVKRRIRRQNGIYRGRMPASPRLSDDIERG